MIWKTDCSRTKTLLALWVGNDLDEAGQAAARSHLDNCPRCRLELRNLESGQRVLDQVSVASRLESVEQISLWPDLAKRLAVPREKVRRSQPFNGNRWLPTGALVAACLVIFVALDNAARQQRPSGQSHSSFVVQPRMNIPVGWPGWQAKPNADFDFQPRVKPWPRDEKLTFPPEQLKILPMEPYDPSSF